MLSSTNRIDCKAHKGKSARSLSTAKHPEGTEQKELRRRLEKPSLLQLTDQASGQARRPLTLYGMSEGSAQFDVEVIYAPCQASCHNFAFLEGYAWLRKGYIDLWNMCLTCHQPMTVIVTSK